jgi:hypothetical protein
VGRIDGVVGGVCSVALEDHLGSDVTHVDYQTFPIHLYADQRGAHEGVARQYLLVVGITSVLVSIEKGPTHARVDESGKVLIGIYPLYLVRLASVT